MTDEPIITRKSRSRKGRVVGAIGAGVLVVAGVATLGSSYHSPEPPIPSWDTTTTMLHTDDPMPTVTAPVTVVPRTVRPSVPSSKGGTVDMLDDTPCEGSGVTTSACLDHIHSVVSGMEGTANTSDPNVRSCEASNACESAAAKVYLDREMSSYMNATASMDYAWKHG